MRTPSHTPPPLEFIEEAEMSLLSMGFYIDGDFTMEELHAKAWKLFDAAQERQLARPQAQHPRATEASTKTQTEADSEAAWKAATAEKEEKEEEEGYESAWEEVITTEEMYQEFYAAPSDEEEAEDRTIEQASQDPLERQEQSIVATQQSLFAQTAQTQPTQPDHENLLQREQEHRAAAASATFRRLTCRL